LPTASTGTPGPPPGRRRRFRQVGLTHEDYKILGEFRRGIREFLAFSEEAALAHGLTAQQHQALLAIRAHSGEEPMSMGELAECLMIKSHSAVGLISRLEDRDLVIRRESQDDRRKALLELRPRGAEILEAISVRNVRKIGRSPEFLHKLIRASRRLAKHDPDDGA
jgi:DNA-binding MarR family transcriptional regulator